MRISTKRLIQSDDFAYLSPMAAFLLLTWVGGHWAGLYPASYVLKTVLAAGLLIYFRNYYTKISWSWWWLGIIVGIVGVVQWVGMEELILKYWPDYPRPSVEIWNPHEHFKSPTLMWAFIILRWAGAALVVPFMEELFWRDYLWRTMVAPNNFKLAPVGEWDWKAFLFVALLFATVHVQWMTAIGWGLMIGGLLVLTRSLGACIIAHGVTNFLLGIYVLRTQNWYFW